MAEAPATSDLHSEPSPLWGSLPAEQYLTRNWDWHSTDPPAVQRLKLVRRFLDLPEISHDLDVLGSCRDAWGSRNGWSPHLWPGTDTVVVPQPPTLREIETILKPWRPLRLRRIAVAFWLHIAWRNDEALWLRTYYGSGSNEFWEKFLDTEREENPRYDGADDARFLNDEGSFNLQSNWELLFDLLPETRGYPPRSSLVQTLEQRRQEIVRLIQRKESKDFGHGFVVGWKSRVWSEVQIMQHACCSGYIVVADEEAFASGRLWLIFYDCMRNIVRHGRIPVDEACMVTVYEMQGRFAKQYSTEGSATYCELGEKYRPGGEFGCDLYDLGDSVLTQELREVLDRNGGL